MLCSFQGNQIEYWTESSVAVGEEEKGEAT